METSVVFSKDVEVAAIRFQKGSDQVRFESYPRRLVYKGREYTLVEA